MDYKNAYHKLLSEFSKTTNELKLLKQVSSSETYNLGNEFFSTIVLQLNAALQADFTFIGKLENQGIIDTISICSENEIVDNFRYELKNTPCENVVGKSVCCYPNNVTVIFPEDTLLQQMNITGYVGVPLFNSRKEAIGIMAALYKKPVESTETAQSILLMHAARAGAEIEHQALYNELLKTKNLLEEQNNQIQKLNKALKIQNNELEISEKETSETNKQLLRTNEYLIHNEQDAWINGTGLLNILDSIPEGIIIESQDRKIKLVNKKICSLLNLKNADKYLTGLDCLQAVKKISSLFIKEEVFIQQTKNIIHSGKEVSKDTLRLKDGRVLERDYIPIVSESGSKEYIWIYRDITELKKSLKALQKSGHRLQSIFRAVPAGIGILKNRVFVDVNPMVCEISGYSREELIGNSARMLYPTQEEYDYVGEEKYRQISEKGTGTVVVKWKKKNGDIIHVLLSSTPMDLNNILEGVTFTALDITENHKLQEALKQSQERFENIMKATNDGVFDWDLITNEAYLSPGYKRMLGYSDEELENNVSTWKNLTHPKDFEKATNLLSQHISEKEERVEVELRMRHKDGHWINILSRSNLVFNNNGEAIRLIGTHLDLTETNRTATELKKTTSLLLKSQEVAQMGSWELDIVNLNLTWSSEVYRIFGVTPDTFTVSEESFYELVHPDDTNKLRETYYRSLENGDDTFEFEHRILRADNHETRYVIEKCENIKDGSGKIIQSIGIVQDITERKNSELAFAESERKLKSLIESTQIIAWELDASTQKFTYMSPSIKKLTGYTPSEWTDFEFWKHCLHPEDKEWAVNFCLGQTEKGLDHFLEYRLLTKHGEIKWVKDHVFLVKENDRLLLRGFFQDDTESKLAQLKLQESEKKYRQLFENMTSGFALHEIIYDKKGKPIDYKYLDANPAFEKLTGVKPSEIIGKRIREIMPNTEDYWIEEFGNVALTGKSITYENYSQEIGKYFNVYAFSPEKNQFAVVFYDITKRKEAEKKLKESELRLRQLSELTFEGILIHDNGVAINVNNSFIKMSGYKRDELIGKNLIEILVPNKYKKTVYQKTSQKPNEPYEFEMLTKKGNLIPIEVNSRVIPKSKGIRVASFRDISERKQIRQRITEARIKAEEQERERYAKELHDGLGPILSTCKVYFKTLESVQEETRKQRHIERTNELLEEALRSIREISNNLSPHVLRNYGLTQALNSFIDKLSGLSKVHFKLNSNIKYRLPEPVEFTIYRTLVELINNSIKHSKAERITITIQATNEDLVVHYLDNGKGFEYEKTKQKAKGFGLLNLEQRIKEIRGTYVFNSSPGKGVKVEIALKL